MIELKKINKTFYKKGREIPALSNISLTVPKGQIFGIIGASGAGKSTLIRCVNLLEKPDSGEIWIDDENLTALSPRGLTTARRNIGMIFQHFNLMSSRTVSQNVALPLELTGTNKAVINNRVTELLALVGLEDKAHDYPSNLSGGQKQRVAIARTLATNPKVLLCDEATSALDPATTTSILSLLKDINKRFNITILLITHEMNVVKSICDKVAVISEGKIVEQGNIHDIAALAATEIALPQAYKNRLVAQSDSNFNPVIRLEFNKEISTGFLSEVSRLYNIDNNILNARIDDAHASAVLFIQLNGEKADTQKAIAFYQNKNIKVEVLGYV